MARVTNAVDVIVKQLRLGNVAAIPTETVYGLAADATNKLAVEKIFNIKNRPLNHPLIMHVSPDWDLNQWVETIPEYALKLMKAFWPGPLTCVFRLKKEANITPLITGNQTTIAIRSPAHPLALEVLHTLGRPLVAPSANPFGKVSPTETLHIMSDFPEEPFLILEGGSCKVGIESTIISCINENDCSILRHGIISQADLQTVCGVLKTKAFENRIRVSGNLKQHYQPKKPLFYFNHEEISDVKKALGSIDNSLESCLMPTPEDARQEMHCQPPPTSTNTHYLLCFANSFDNNIANYVFPTCPKKAARELYRALRIADQSTADTILIELPKETPEWAGLVDRIKKAGRSFRVDN